MRQPQPAPGAANADTGERDTTYKVWLYYPSNPVGGAGGVIPPPGYKGKYSMLERNVKVVPNKGCVEFATHVHTPKHNLPTIANGADNYA